MALLAIASLLCTVACEQDIDVEEFPPKDIEFSYHSESLHYVIGEEITFNNESVVGTSWQWNFGDGTTSSDENPVHIYRTPGTYKVTLTVDEKHTIEKSLMISDIVPIISYQSTDPVVVFNQSEVQFDVFVLNPEELAVEYTWSFPEGTTGEAIGQNLTSGEKSPKAMFGTLGSQVVSLTVKIGEKVLDPVSVNVKVYYNEPVRTLYYAVKEGNIMANKLIPGMSLAVNKPFDYGYRSGKHPLSLQFEGDNLYVFDAGTRTGYTAGNATLGDGEIFIMSHDGARRETVIENFGGDTYNDFYYGYVDQTDIYWANRREGIFRINKETRNKKFSLDEIDYFVKNAWLGYYGKGIGWGHVNGPISMLGDVFYWGKNSNGKGIFRFKETDISTNPDEVPVEGAIANNFSIRGLAIDEVNGKVYFSDSQYIKFFRCNLDGSELEVIDGSPADTEGGQSELLFITGIAVDVDENGNGYVYWAYRGPDVPEGENPEEYYATNPLHKSGIKRYSLNDPNAQVEYFVEDVEVYGLAIDNTMR